MKNPLRDEASAFQVVLITLGGAVLVVLAAWINTWLGLAVFIVLVGAALWAIRGGLIQRPPQAHVVHDGGGARKILVVANETVGGDELFTLLGRKAEDADEEMLLICPALNSRVRTWTSDEDPARADAQERLDASLARLATAGVIARGEIGDGDPLQALEDALREFPADEIVVSTHPPGRSNWLEQGVVEQARQRYDVPVTHVVVDLEVSDFSRTASSTESSRQEVSD
ncbi:MAG TPA: universal stress protein [Gaiella sp.]|nr:universal stress protein [Gaiella sp.]